MKRLARIASHQSSQSSPRSSPQSSTYKLVLAPRHLAIVRQVLQTHAPKHQAYAFGSRVVANATDQKRVKPHSDLDLVLDGPRLKPAQAFALREAFSESDLPMRVDAVPLIDLPSFWEIRAWPL